MGEKGQNDRKMSYVLRDNVVLNFVILHKNAKQSIFCNTRRKTGIYFSKTKEWGKDMAVTVKQNKRVEKSPCVMELLSGILPYKLYGELIDRDLWGLEEIRCRKGRYTYITQDRKNIMLSHLLTDGEMEKMTDRIFGGSLYAHKETLLEGFITLEGGIRVGICGRAAVENNRIIGIYDISGINIRLPSYPLNIGGRICDLLSETGTGGVLLFSPPGIGKTTLLRSVASKMASGRAPKRVCIVDTRGEIGASLDGKGLSLDVLVGYPRSKGIEIATRTLCAELIVCDEIGNAQECDTILEAQNCGVPLLASAHAESLPELLRRKGIRALHDACVFRYYVGLHRQTGTLDFTYEITDREAACDSL